MNTSKEKLKEIVSSIDDYMRANGVSQAEISHINGNDKISPYFHFKNIGATSAEKLAHSIRGRLHITLEEPIKPSIAKILLTNGQDFYLEMVNLLFKKWLNRGFLETEISFELVQEMECVQFKHPFFSNWINSLNFVVRPNGVDVNPIGLLDVGQSSGYFQPGKTAEDLYGILKLYTELEQSKA